MVFTDPTGLEWIQKPDGTWVATEETDTLASGCKKMGYATWQEAARANGISYYYDEKGNYANGKETLTDRVFIGKSQYDALSEEAKAGLKAVFDKMEEIDRNSGYKLIGKNKEGNAVTPKTDAGFSSWWGGFLSDVIQMMKNASTESPSSSGRVGQGGGSYFPADGPCAFLSLIGMLQTQTGIILSDGELKSIESQSRKNGGLPSSGWWILSMKDVLAAGAECYMSNYNITIKIIHANRTGTNADGTAVISWGSDELMAQVTNTILMYPRGGPGKTHFVEGDKNGNPVWDPLGGMTVSGSPLRIDWFIITVVK
jgi:hypothetical protein